MTTKYIYGALILYVLMAGIVVAVHPSSNEVDIVLDGLLWPKSILAFVWDNVANMYGRLLD